MLSHNHIPVVYQENNTRHHTAPSSLRPRNLDVRSFKPGIPIQRHPRIRSRSAETQSLQGTPGVWRVCRGWRVTRVCPAGRWSLDLRALDGDVKRHKAIAARVALFRAVCWCHLATLRCKTHSAGRNTSCIPKHVSFSLVQARGQVQSRSHRNCIALGNQTFVVVETRRPQ